MFSFDSPSKNVNILQTKQDNITKYTAALIGEKRTGILQHVKKKNQSIYLLTEYMKYRHLVTAVLASSQYED
jgi:hypothetical protein